MCYFLHSDCFSFSRTITIITYCASQLRFHTHTSHTHTHTHILNLSLSHTHTHTHTHTTHTPSATVLRTRNATIPSSPERTGAPPITPLTGTSLPPSWAQVTLVLCPSERSRGQEASTSPARPPGRRTHGR